MMRILSVGERSLSLICLQKLSREMASGMVFHGEEIGMAVSCNLRDDRAPYRLMNRTSALGILRFYLLVALRN